MCRSVREELFDRLATMDRRTIPDDEQLARDLPQGVSQEAHHVWTLEGPLLVHHQQLALQGDAADYREMVAAKVLVQDGRPAHRGVGAHYRRQQVKSRLIHEQNGPALLYGPFFSSGQRSSFQLLMAFSSRWFARRSGFCKESPSALTSRLTCAGW